MEPPLSVMRRRSPRASREVTAEPVVMPRSKRKATGHGHETLGPMTREERRDLLRERFRLMVYQDVRFGPPKDDRDCPPGPCPHVGCRHHNALETKGRNVTLNFPGRNVDEMPETCSLRVARKYAAERLDKVRPGEPVMTLAEVGRFLNMSEWPVEQALRSALRKIKTWLERNAGRQSETR